MTNYIGLIRKDADSDFSVDFPDFPGCVSASGTLDEARAMGSEALNFHIEGMREDGDILPEPSSLEEVMADQDNREAVAFLASVTEPEKSVRVNVTLPVSVLDRIARVSKNRSGFLAEAAQEKLARDSA